MKILVLNAGSSSVKAASYNLTPADLDGAPLQPSWSAKVTWSKVPGEASLESSSLKRSFAIEVPADVIAPLVEAATGEHIDVVGHRVVHGGGKYREPVRISAEVTAEISRFAEFAPEHNRLEVAGFGAVERHMGASVPQFAVFDTAFHATLPEAAYVYAGPYSWLEKGLRRYGFHGINHQYVSERARRMMNRADARIVSCHLGNGCSLAAILNGKSVDTTMGFTPLDGLMMGTRSGSVDPGILIYLMRHEGCTADQLDHILNAESGLKGISGLSEDMRKIIEGAESGDSRAHLAFDMYVHSLCRAVGSMAAALNGVDALLFTGGVGEHSHQVREQVCKRLAFLGIELDSDLNQNAEADGDLATSASSARVFMIHAQEEWQIARECFIAQSSTS